MGLSFSAPITTNAGTVLITAAGTFKIAKAIQTAAGTSVFTSSGDYNADIASSGQKVMIPFAAPANLTTSLTTFLVPCLGHADAVHATAKKAHIPWAGSVIGYGLRAGPSAISAGNITGVPFNGTTSLSGTITANTTNSTVVNAAVITAGTKAFTANNLKFRIKTAAALSGPTRCLAMVWVEV